MSKETHDSKNQSKIITQTDKQDNKWIIDASIDIDKINQNQKILDVIIEEWKVWDNKIKMLEFELSSKDFEISQDTFNQRAYHYLDKKNVLNDVYMRVTGKDIKELS